MSAFAVEELRAVLLDLKQPLAKRTHTAFYLRTDGSPAAVAAICDALLVREDSSLMRHELAYILGQIQNADACPILSTVLCNEEDDILVRHESAEALGAIGDPTSIEILSKYVDHSAPEIRETCQIAIDLIRFRQAGGKIVSSSRFQSVDPAPPIVEVKKSLNELEAELLDTSKSLFLRYR